MKNRIVTKRNQAERRARRARIRLHGTAERPRLTIKRSLRHIYAQLINDDMGQTVASASDKVVNATGTPVEVAAAVGTELAKRATAAGITQMVVDRGPYRYHGRLKALVDAAEAGGLQHKRTG